MKIQPLQRIIVSEDGDGTQTSRLPDNLEMMNKINEIIHVVNRLDSTIESRQVQNLFKPRVSF